MAFAAQPHITITGDRTVDRRLKQFGPKLAKKIFSKVIRKAAKPVLETARNAVPVDSGDLRRSLKIRARKRSRRNKNTVGVQVVTGERFFKGELFYGGFLEFGWRTGKRGSDKRTQVQPKPFLRPAYDQNKSTVRNIFQTAMKAQVEQAAKETK
jgi:HK97 gp10 family phage protein